MLNMVGPCYYHLIYQHIPSGYHDAQPLTELVFSQYLWTERVNE